MRTIADYFRLNPDAAGQFRFVTDLYSSLVEVFGDPDRVIPIPARIRMTGSAQSVFGYPVVANANLRRALAAYAEEETRYLTRQILKARHRDPNLKIEAGPRLEAKTAYETLLGGILEAATIHGASYRTPELFWIYHSGDIARAVADSLKTIGTIDRALLATDGVHIKYRLLRMITSLIVDTIHIINSRIALDTSFDRAATAPPVVQIMMRNVLLLSNVPGPLSLDDVNDYLTGVIRTDPAKFRRDLEALRQLLLKECRADSRLFEAVKSVRPEVKTLTDVTSDGVIMDARIGQFVALQKGIAPPGLLALLAQLRPRFVEYEIVHHLRTLVIECNRKADEDTGLFKEKLVLESDPAKTVDTSETTVFDFNRPTIIEDRLERFGLVYDINSFTATYTEIIRQHSSIRERQSVRQMYAFQQVISGLSERFRVRFEKFLGDGSFFTSQRALDLVMAASVIQDAYSKARENGFVFDKGIRIALNYNHYYVIPLQFDGASGRFPWTNDYLGSGLIELTRLTTGKSLTNLPELKTWLIAAGYPADEVEKFLSRPQDDSAKPGTTRPPQLEIREFWVEVGSKGELNNEGIALTSEILQKLALEISRLPLAGIRYANYDWIGFKANDISRNLMFRLAGTARLKGLEPLPVIEMVSLDPEHAGMAYEITRPRLKGNLHDLVTGSATAEEVPPDAEIVPEEPAISQVDLPENTICYFGFTPPEGGNVQYYLGRIAPGRKGLINALATPHDLTRMDPKRILSFYLSFEQNPDQLKESVPFEKFSGSSIQTVQAVPG